MRVKHLVIGLVILVLLAGFVLFFMMGQKINELEKQDFAQVDIAGLPDGSYQGKAAALLVTAQVEVVVQEGRIRQVKLLEHRHGPGYGAEKILDSIVEANSPDVDCVTGATASSTVVKSAVLDALKSGLTP
ncbi:MAG: FMN-binding protein [Bacillota bacterium]|nr:FMN-binding protein [Bacillota bacterium]